MSIRERYLPRAIFIIDIMYIKEIFVQTVQSIIEAISIRVELSNEYF
jgi:hypothetical protein